MAFDGSRAEFYVSRAQEVGKLAEKCRDMTIKEQLLHVAREYEALAKMVRRGTLER